MRQKIWHLNSNRWNSAITEYALSAARALAGSGNDCHFFPLAGSPGARRAIEHLVTTPLAAFDLRTAPLIWSLARQHKPDIVLAYGGPETVLARVVQLACNAKVGRFRGYGLENRLLAGLRWQFAHQHVGVVLTPSEGLAAAVKGLGVGPPVRCVQLGCDTQVFKPGACGGLPSGNAAGLSAAEGRPEIVLLGRLDPVKGHAAVIELLAPLLRASSSELGGRPRPRLHIVGEPANLTVAAIEAMVWRSGLKLGDDVVITAGRVANVAQLMASAALAVVPSLGSEFICRTAEEFLLCGTPVVVSGAGATEEVLFPGAGFSYRTLTPVAAREQFCAWLRRREQEGPDEQERRAQQARARFSLPAMAAALTSALAGTCLP